MLTRLGSILLFTLLPGTATATFEIEDPAAEVYASTPEGNAKALDQIPCIDFLLAGAKDAREYKQIVARLRQYHFDQKKEAIDLPSEEAVKAYCVDHPKTSLKIVSDTLAP